MKLVKLSEVCIFNPPKNEARLALNTDQLVSFMPMQDLGIESIIAEAISSRPLGEVIKAYTYFAENDVLIAKITPCFENGKMGIARNLVNGVGFGSSEYFVLRPMDSILSEYLYYFLRQEIVIENGRGIMTGAVGHRRVPADYLENLEIPLPSVERQGEIVEELDIAFAEIDSLQSNHLLSEEKISNLLQSLLSDTFAQSSSEPSLTKPIVSEDDPSNLYIKPLGELCSLTMGRTPPRGNSKFWDPSRRTNNVWISIADMTKSADGILIDSKEYLSNEGSNTFPKVEAGTLLLSFKLTIGTLAIAGTELQTNEAIVAMNNLKEDQILRDYLFYYLYGFDWREALEGRFKVKGNTLNKQILELLPIQCPSLEKQREIIIKLDKAFSEIESLKQQIKAKQFLAADVPQSILRRAFSHGERVA